MFQDFEIAPQARLWIHLLWAAPAVILLAYLGIAWRARRLQAFGFDPVRSAAWLASLRRRRIRRSVLLAVTAVFLTAAAVQPRVNPEKTTFTTNARDIAIILDVSRSMLAADLQPSRLERAKIELARLCDHLKGDRVGLIVFAGDAVIKCPLTSNYSYVKSVLRTVGPKSASQGGSKIGDAVRKALKDLFGLRAETTADDEQKGPGPGETVIEEELKGRKETHADILLVTDGEDLGSYPVHAARMAARLDVGIYAVGLGSEEGSSIPVQGEGGRVEYLRSKDGEEVRSRLDSKTIQEMVNTAARGQYLPVGTHNFDLVDFFEKTIEAESGREVVEEQVAWTEIFQPFLLAGIALYVAHLLFPERPRRGLLEVPAGEARA